MSATKPLSGRPSHKGGWISPSDRVRWGDAVRAALAVKPAATLRQLVDTTGAPPGLASEVRRRWKQQREACA
jgi:hypothetical protein